mmetsp:Transcript_129592/g.242472  ORF Transcript_129592/g.242472 Transcript_129592/m.242472 type:complete len:213 (+) Transcript_129592:166-804(+)
MALFGPMHVVFLPESEVRIPGNDTSWVHMTNHIIVRLIIHRHGPSQPRQIVPQVVEHGVLLIGWNVNGSKSHCLDAALMTYFMQGLHILLNLCARPFVAEVVRAKHDDHKFWRVGHAIKTILKARVYGARNICDFALKSSLEQFLCRFPTVSIHLHLNIKTFFTQDPLQTHAPRHHGRYIARGTEACCVAVTITQDAQRRLSFACITHLTLR